LHAPLGSPSWISHGTLRSQTTACGACFIRLLNAPLAAGNLYADLSVNRSGFMRVFDYFLPEIVETYQMENPINGFLNNVARAVRGIIGDRSC
jgi:hypothetical protein